MEKTQLMQCEHWKNAYSMHGEYNKTQEKASRSIVCTVWPHLCLYS